MKKLTEKPKFQINYYGERVNGMHVNFTYEGKEHDTILRGKFNLKFFQIEEALEELTPYELSECEVIDAEDIRRDDQYEDWEIDLMLQEELS